MKKLKSLIYGTIPYFYCRLFAPQSPALVYYRYIHQKRYARHLYLFAHEYADFDPEVLKDVKKNLYYVWHKGKRLYFPLHLSVKKIKGMYKALVMEQDVRSPHCYMDSEEEVRGRVFVDVGAAEGMIALNVVEVAEKIYLFECAEEWLEALQATFASWPEKVVFVNKYVGKQDDVSHVTLDRFLEHHSEERLFLKMDVEGAEREVLEGAKMLFSSARDLKFAVCAYHLSDDERVISTFLRKYNCSFRIQRGFFNKRYKAVVFRGNNRVSFTKIGFGHS